MAHEDNLAASTAVLGCLVLLDVSYALSDLIRVSVKMAKATCLVRRRHIQCEEGPFRVLQRAHDITRVGSGRQPIRQTSDEEDTVGMTSGRAGSIFKRDQALCLHVAGVRVSIWYIT